MSVKVFLRRGEVRRMVDKEQQEAIGAALARLVTATIGWEEPLDGAATEGIAKAFLKEIDELSGNG